MKKNNTFNINFNGKIISIALLFGVFIMLGLYMYMISMSVVNVVINKEMQQAIALVESDITELEADYISQQYDFNKEEAVELGYVESEEKVFIAKNDTKLVVSRNER